MQKLKKLVQEIGVLSLSITIVFIAVMGISMVKGWVEPTVAPPGGNLGAPINTGNVHQIKNAGLTLNNLSTSATGLTVNKGIESLNGDVCATVGGVRKCLSTGGGGTAVPSGIYGYCVEESTSADGRFLTCSDAIAPAVCSYYNGNKKCWTCLEGYTVVTTGQYDYGDTEGSQHTLFYYSCIKN